MVHLTRDYVLDALQEEHFVRVLPRVKTLFSLHRYLV